MLTLINPQHLANKSFSVLFDQRTEQSSRFLDTNLTKKRENGNSSRNNNNHGRQCTSPQKLFMTIWPLYGKVKLLESPVPRLWHVCRQQEWRVSDARPPSFPAPPGWYQQHRCTRHLAGRPRVAAGSPQRGGTVSHASCCFCFFKVYSIHHRTTARKGGVPRGSLLGPLPLLYTPAEPTATWVAEQLSECLEQQFRLKTIWHIE